MATPPAPTSARTGVRARQALAVGAWIVVVAVARVWADAMQEGGRVIRLKAPPLVGFDVVRLSWRNLGAVVVGVALVVVLPRLCRRLAWRWTLVCTSAATLLWSLALAVVDGWAGITRGVRWKSDEYLFEVDAIDSPLAFVRDFTGNLDGYVTHVRAHPPGTVLILWAMDRVGLSGFGWNAALYLAVAVLGVAAVLIAVREVVDEATARAAAPFLAVAPAAIWVATTADAMFAGVGAWACALVILATGRTGRRSTALAAGGGLLFGLLAFLSYGHLLVALVPLVVAVDRRRLDCIVVAALATIPWFLGFLAAGFWWLDGLSATRGEYAESVARDRPYGPFLLFNTAAFGLALGPAMAAALVTLRDRRLWLLVGGALGAVGIAMVTGLSKGEVERIWLPFALWILPAGAALVPTAPADDPADGPGRPTADNRVGRAWLALQAVAALAVQSLLKPRW